MRCEHAQQLFDQYLDGELSSALKSELGTHLLGCSKCRQALALMEVTGHIVSSDQEVDCLDEEFTDRLLACVEQSGSGRFRRLRRAIYIGGPLAAAAVVAFGFLGVFSRTDTKVAGHKHVVPTPMVVVDASALPPSPDKDMFDPADERLERWLVEGQEHTLAASAEGDERSEAFDMTILQLIDYCNEAMKPDTETEPSSGTEPARSVTPIETPPPTDDDVEDV